jgi:hypothetical protein
MLLIGRFIWNVGFLDLGFNVEIGGEAELAALY